MPAMTDVFSADAARALGGPDWLVARRLAAAEALGTISWPTADEEIWRYSRIGELDLARYRPFVEAELGHLGDEPCGSGGRWAAEAGKHAAMLVVRDGRVVLHEIDPGLEAKGVGFCGLATCGGDEVQAL